MNIKRLMDLGTWRGMRHRKGLPVRGPAHAHQCPHPQGAAQASREAQRAAGQGLMRATADAPTRTIVLTLRLQTGDHIYG
jgi:hypothetical protein